MCILDIAMEIAMQGYTRQMRQQLFLISARVQLNSVAADGQAEVCRPTRMSKLLTQKRFVAPPSLETHKKRQPASANR